MLPDTDFPDIRTVSKIQSQHGSSLMIPRENDTIRLYLQIDETTGLIDEEGRLDRSSVTPESLMKIARKTLQPYKMEMVGEPNWWTVYMSESCTSYQRSVKLKLWNLSRPACSIKILCGGPCLYCGRCMPYTFSQSWPRHERRHQ